MCANIGGDYPEPASYRHFNQHPRAWCQQEHNTAIGCTLLLFVPSTEAGWTNLIGANTASGSKNCKVWRQDHTIIFSADSIGSHDWLTALSKTETEADKAD